MPQFLTDEWFAAAIELRDRYADRMPEPAIEVRINQVITDVPFGDGVVHAFIDTSDGSATVELGEVEEPDAIVTTDYDTARAMFVDQDPAAAMQAFMEGRVKVQGDMMKLMAVQAQAALPDAPGADVAAELAEELRSITE